jgi:PTS system ascorbate-specific IIB component
MMKVLAVCAFGVGSSMALRMQLEKIFKSKGLSVEVDNTDLATASSMKVDAIFTSPVFVRELQAQVKCPVLGVEQFMNAVQVTEAVELFLAAKGGIA